MGQPLLSIGLIVKNEIRCIERCLQALQPLRNAISCELVIADTGSTDGTREVCERYADVLFDFEWINDFAAARNAVMDRATGKWFLTIDADEYLDSNVSELVKFLTSPGKRGKYDAAYVVIRNYFKKSLEGTFQDFSALRLVCMDSKARYSGAIHEHLQITMAHRIRYCSKTIFHHDGYAFETAQEKQNKAERNMKLLREELKKHPDDVRTLIQAVESCTIYPQERQGYLDRGMSLLENNHDLFQNPFAQALCRTAVVDALHQKRDGAEAWLSLAEQYMGHTLFYQIDVILVAASYWYNKENYDTALKYLERYFSAIDRVKTMDHAILMAESRASSLFFQSENSQCEARCLQVRCYAVTEQMDLAVEAFLSIEPPNQNSTYLSQYFGAASNICSDVRVRESFAHQVQSALDSDDSKWAGQWKGFVNQIFYFNSEQYQLLLRVAGEIGLSAQLIGATREEMPAIMDQIEDWNKVPVRAIWVIIQQGVSVPESFYQISLKNRRSIVSELLKAPERTPVFLNWLETIPKEESLLILQFYYDTLTVIAQHYPWEDTDESKELVDRFLRTSENFLTHYYHADVLQQEENWCTLLEVHHVALCLLKGKRCLEQNDELGYVRELHTAMNVEPGMGKMVQYMKDHPPIMTISHELAQLAAQVQKILSMYSPNDPAVMALKASPVYQRVAHLLTL